MNIFHPKQFNNLASLVKLKKEKNLTIGIAIPILNEIQTLERTIKVVLDCKELIDEVVFLDSGSTDGSVEYCKKLGIKVISDIKTAQILNVQLARGKGWNLWSSLYYLDADIIAWVDSDLKNFNKKFITGIIGPMLQDDKVKFVKGYWCRKNSGGRITEIMVRPFINLVFPELREFIQPLSGEYGGRKDFLRSLVFYSGFSVEFAVLVQARMLLNDDEIVQSFLGKRLHANQSTKSLGKISSSILFTMLYFAKQLDRLKYEDDDMGKSLLSFYSEDGKEICIERSSVVEKALPPINSLLKINTISSEYNYDKRNYEKEFKNFHQGHHLPR